MYENGKYAKLADFGYSRHIENSQSLLSLNAGTQNYWGPEIWRNSPMKQKSDMYPLGHILHFMMTKTFPDYKNNVKTGCFDVSPNYS